MTDTASDSRNESTESELPAEPAADAAETPVVESSAEPTNEEPAESAGDTAEALTEDDLPITRGERRFQKLVDEKKQAEANAQDLRERLEQYEKPEPAEDPPEEDARMQARKMIEQDAQAFLEREMGMPIAEMKARLAASQRADNDYAKRRWGNLCTEQGLDPASEDLQAYVSGLAKFGNVPIEKALERAKTIFKPKPKPSASVETNGNTGTMTKDDAIFWDKRSATAAAEKGIRAKHVPLDEIIERGLALESRKGN